MNKPYIIPIFVPHYGCPHDCIFCNQKKITNVSTTTKQEDVQATIEEYLSYFWKDREIELAFYGGSFTAIDIDIQSKLLEIPLKYKEEGIINRIRLSTRPDAINREILENLKKYKVDIIELGVQSLDEQVLLASERGHSIEDVYKAVELIKEYGFQLGLQMMVGLPEDTMIKAVKTTKEFIKMAPDLVRIYPTLVIKDTYLAHQYYKNEYKPLTVKEAVDICTILLILFYLENINVIRVGLQATENIQLGMDVVSGPFHPAFRQLVEANIYKLAIDDFLNNLGYDCKGKVLMIQAKGSMISAIAGQKSSNIKGLREKFNFSKVKIYPNGLEDEKLIITVGDKREILDLKAWMEYYIAKLDKLDDC